MSKPALVLTADEALANIRRFATEVEKSAELQNRLGHGHSWYAIPTAEGTWAFGPSKFVGYRSNSARQYLRTDKQQTDGRTTEKQLEPWFETVDPDSPLGIELGEALHRFLGRWNRSPRKNARINVLKSELDQIPDASRRGGENGDHLITRISTDSRICGGRPCIKGTRMRVSDIIDMLAHGVTREEILEDFPYLAEDDIWAALAYAARAADHRVIRAA